MGRRTHDQEVASSIPGHGCGCVRTTLGKLFTPVCLDADSLRYYMESLIWVLLPLPEDAPRIVPAR